MMYGYVVTMSTPGCVLLFRSEYCRLHGSLSGMQVVCDYYGHSSMFLRTWIAIMVPHTGTILLLTHFHQHTLPCTSLTLPSPSLTPLHCTHRNAWMIRDTAKLLCRIVEEHENTAKRGRGETMFSPNRRGLATPLNLPGLTDRNEWPDCTLKAFHYGAELNKGFKRKNFIEESEEALEGLEGIEGIEGMGGMEGGEPAVMVTISGEGSPVEEFIKTMQTDGKAIPTRIMLTGMRAIVFMFY